MNLKELIHSDYDTQNAKTDTYAEFRLVQNYAQKTKAPKNLQQRIVRKLRARNLIQPFGEYDCRLNAIIELDGVLYSIPKTWPRNSTPADDWATKQEAYLDKRRNQCLSFATNYFPLRRIHSVTLITGVRPRIDTEDTRNNKYARETRILVPTGWLNHANYSTNEFLVLKRHDDAKEIDGLTVQTVSGWWKSDIRGTQTHYPTTAFLAHSNSIRSITRSERTAIQGLRTRLTNQVMRTIAA